MQLTATQIETFHHEGYLAVEGVLDSADLDVLIADFDVLVDEVAQDLYREGVISER